MSIMAGIETVHTANRDLTTAFPLAVLYPDKQLRKERMISDLLPDSCTDCSPERYEQAVLLARESGRLSVGQVILAVEEQLPCVHID